MIEAEARPIRIPLRYPAEKGLVLYLPFDRIGEKTTFDLSPYRNHGTIYGAVWVPGKFGQALSFDGVDDYVIIPKSESLDITERITVAAWFKLYELPSVVGRRMDIYSMSAGGVVVYIFIDNKLGFGVNIGGTWYFLGAPTVLSKDVWYHVTCVYDQTKQKIYLNGVLDAEVSRTGLMAVSGSPRAIGRHPIFSQYHFQGLIDEVRIYNRALSEEEIKEHYYRLHRKFHQVSR
jgi:hypothetical protein